ncbi:Zeta toxin [Novymonas esmeraldas]|uniref:Zeta toxin n=1 Tax=Novymonas esmeraldas TaxID=1808958 RepID=A0AAW0F526_9TRYP
MQSPPPYVPFVEYVLKALEHPPYMYVAKLAACCTMLFLTRENPELLQALCHKWAVRFAKDRRQLIRHIRKRASYCINSPEPAPSLVRDGKVDGAESSDDGCAPLPPQAPSHNRDDESGDAIGVRCCDPDEAVEHLLSILNTLVPMYFSWNWHRADYVIQINREYEAYVREYILPMCVELTPEDGPDDTEHTPWLLPPHTYLEAAQNVTSFYTPTSTVAPYPRTHTPRRSSTMAAGTPVMGISPLPAAGNTNAAFSLGAHYLASAGGSPVVHNAETEWLPFPNLQQHFGGSATGKGERFGGAASAQLPKFSLPSGKAALEDGTSAASPSSLLPSAQASSSAFSGPSLPMMSPNVMSARAFNAAAVYGLRFLTLGNYRDALQSNTKGLVTVFHAKYSAKSNDVIDVFQKITAKRLLDPMPTIAVVYAVAEPELSSLYKVSWFPTIVYTPPLRYQRSHQQQSQEPASPAAHSRTVRPYEDYARPAAAAAADSRKETAATTLATAAAAVVAPALTAISGLARVAAATTAKHALQRPHLPDARHAAVGAAAQHSADTPRRIHSRSLQRKQQQLPTAVGSGGGVAIGVGCDAHDWVVSTATASDLATPSTSNSTVSQVCTPVRCISGIGDKSGGHPSTTAVPPMCIPAASTRSERGGVLVSSPNLGAGVAPPTPSEILFGISVGDSVHSVSMTSPPQFTNGSLANSSFQSSSMETGILPAADCDGGQWCESLQDLLNGDDHVIYPLDGVQTVPALVEWIGARGASVPHLRKMKEFFNCIKSIREKEKFKRYRELHSAVVTLRRLQGIKDDFGVPNSSNNNNSSGSSSTHTPRQSASSPESPQNPDQPLFIFLGGGMAAGKTTAVAALAKSSWWESHKEQSVVVNADEFKLPQECEMASPEAHTHSTRAAENLLVQAINQGRSIVLDGTMMWKPFVQQVVEMVRAAHLTRFKQGPGYNTQTKAERYFVADKARQPALPIPYKIIFLGITVEVETAVPRGFLRKFQTNRGVPISMQLRSFKLFAENFHEYVALVDEVTLYNNNVFVDLDKGELPPILAECTEKTKYQLVVHDEAAFHQFLRQQQINDNAGSVLEVYPVTPVGL